MGTAWSGESSFRIQVIAGFGAILVLVILRPAPMWWALFALVIAAVLAAELFNTALEQVIDRLHPESHPAIGKAKDCAAAAVLVLSICAIAVFTAMLLEICIRNAHALSGSRH